MEHNSTTLLYSNMVRKVFDLHKLKNINDNHLPSHHEINKILSCVG